MSSLYSSLYSLTKRFITQIDNLKAEISTLKNVADSQNTFDINSYKSSIYGIFYKDGSAWRGPYDGWMYGSSDDAIAAVKSYKEDGKLKKKYEIRQQHWVPIKNHE